MVLGGRFHLWYRREALRCLSLFDRKDHAMPHLQNGNMNQRHKISGHKSRKNFSKHATHMKGQNTVSGVMRGGIRF